MSDNKITEEPLNANEISKDVNEAPICGETGTL